VNIPAEVFVWVGGAIFMQFSLCAHLLIAIKNAINEVKRVQGLQEQEMKFLKEMFSTFARENGNHH
jgi:hypothetical protein